MGYYVRIDECSWEIKETPEALATIREMPIKYHALKRGGSYPDGERWFSWMNDTEIKEAPRFEDWYFQMNPRTAVPNSDEFFQVMYDFKFNKKY